MIACAMIDETHTNTIFAEMCNALQNCHNHSNVVNAYEEFLFVLLHTVTSLAFRDRMNVSCRTIEYGKMYDIFSFLCRLLFMLVLFTIPGEPTRADKSTKERIEVSFSRRTSMTNFHHSVTLIFC